MKRLFFLFLLFLLMSSVSKHLHALPISTEEIRQLAIRYFTVLANRQAPAHISSSITFSAGGETMLVHFSFENGGFLVMGTDTRFSPVVAYSLHGIYNSENLSPAESWWLQQIAEHRQLSLQIHDSQDVSEHPGWQLILSGNMQTQASKADPLLITRWGQGCFYNALCPIDSNGPCGRTVTGCVATAMAQIMKYWNFPAIGTGYHEYASTFYGVLSANFGETAYLWNEMPDELTEDNLAVATLMYHCGVAVDMQYTATSSGAYIGPAAFENYFGYSLNAELAIQANYSDDQWKDMLRQQIDNGHPVLYSGYSTIIPDGHAWVVDGYADDDFFHFNWGWDSEGGYYLLDDNMFSINHSAVIKIFPRDECDMKVSEVLFPINMTYTEPASVKVRIENYGSVAVAGIPVAFSVNGTVVAQETIAQTLDPGESLVYEFQQQYDFSATAGGEYLLKVFTELPCDTYRVNDTLAAVVVNVLCADAPYNMAFSADDDINGWLSQDANNDNNTWRIRYFNDNTAYYSGNENPADDWLFSKCISLEAGKLYKIGFDYVSTGMYWPQNVSLHIGSQPASDAMDSLLVILSGFNNNVALQSASYFTVPVSGSYYFGWHCYSEANNLNAAIDNVFIVDLPDPDAMLSEIVSPVSGCELGEEMVSIVVSNLCSLTLENIPVSYSINGSDDVNELIPGPILPGQSISYVFETPANLSEYGNYTLDVRVLLDGDVVIDNNDGAVVVKNKVSGMAPYTIDFEDAATYEDWTIENLNNDNRTWQYKTVGGHNQPACVRYDYNDFSAADDWLISTCVYLEMGYVYRLNFWYKVEDGQWPENLKVHMGTVQHSSGMSQLLGDFQNLTNNSYQQAELLFPIWISGFYHFGFHCYSDMQMFNLYLDDISIEIDHINNADQKNNVNILVYPNPAHNQVFIESTENIMSVEVFDITGKCVIKTGNTNTISLSSLQNGSYILKITGSNTVSMIRLMVE